MSDLDNKNINYAALNRFLQDLKSHDLSELNNQILSLEARIYALEHPNA